MACISYFGGKSSNVFIEFINSKIPKTGIKTYLEPFSGAMGTYMDDPNLKFDVVVYNDKNRHQANLYKCCSEPETFVKYLERLKETLLKTNETEPLKSIKEFNNVDFEELINKYDSEDTYLYLDPPYHRPDVNGDDDSKRLSWYGADKEGVFGPASHRRLLELIKTTKCRWSLSYYYFPLLEELLPKDKYVWTEKEVFRSSAHGGNNSDLKTEQSKGVELLIMNYDPKTGEKL